MTDPTEALEAAENRRQRLLAKVDPDQPALEVPECEFCGTSGCHWSNHAEARADVAAWQREEHALMFPFGDHREES